MNAPRLFLLLACSLLACSQAAAAWLNATSASASAGGQRGLLQAELQSYKPKFAVQGRGTELSSSIVFVSVDELEQQCFGEPLDARLSSPWAPGDGTRCRRVLG
jgi:hypothetical protein